jgi:hypothetical protein
VWTARSKDSSDVAEVSASKSKGGARPVKFKEMIDIQGIQ